MEVKDRIVREALLLFYENGIKAVTMDEIASAMAISKRTIYENFKDKDELLIECIRYNKYILEKRFNAFFAENKNAINLLVFFVVINRKSVINANHRFIIELKKYHPGVFDAVIKKHEPNEHSIFSQIFKIGVEQGYFRSEMQNDIVFNFIKYGFEAIFHNKNLELSEQYSTGEMFEEALKFCVRGITTEKGMKYYEEKLNDDEFINKIKALQKETF